MTTGLDRLAAERFQSLRGKRVGIVTNPTAVDRELRSIVDLVKDAEGVELKAIFGPEHGLGGAAQAGAKVPDGMDARAKVPVYSLYGKNSRPTREMLEGIDALLFDMQDEGVRTYTYLSTLVGVLEAARDAGVEVWVLDRPNPLGGEILEGPLLESGRESFVGPHPLPLRHGLTIGEFARLVNEERGIGANLIVAPLEGWERGMMCDAAAGDWIAPSPNIPTPRAALVYAGFVLLEGTNLSEGRGTTRPFQLFGAPWLDAAGIAEALNQRGLPGAYFRAVQFVPAFSKFQGETCQGIETHVLDAGSFRSFEAAIAALQEIQQRHPQDLQFHKDAFDRLAGTARLRELLENGEDLEPFLQNCENEIQAYRCRRQRFLLYP